MQHQTKVGIPVKGPLGIIFGTIAALTFVAFLIFGKPAFLDGIVQTNPYDALITQETLHEKAAETLKRDIQLIYRKKYMAPLIDSGAAKKPTGPASILAINRSIDSIQLQSLAIRKLYMTDDQSNREREFLITATYTMNPPLDNITTRSFRVVGNNYGKGSWTFYGETSK